MKTGGPLASDTYTLTLFSRTDGFKSTTGELLDGDANGVAGGNFVTTFGVTSSSARVVSVPDFARGAMSGAGQTVNVKFDNGLAGIPISISEGLDVMAIDFDFVFDPSMFIFDFPTLFQNVLPGGWIPNANIVSPGRMSVTLSGTSALPLGSREIIRLLGRVPANTPYGASQLMRIENLDVYTQAGGVNPVPSIADAGVHKAIFVGDTNADGIYSAQDAGFVAGVNVGSFTGFDAHSWTDPVIVADVTQNGAIDGLDSSWISRKGLSAGLQPEIPNLPEGSIITHAGIDPTIAADVMVPGQRGSNANVPIRITDSAVGLFGVDVFVDYDTNRFDLTGGLNLANVQLAGMFVSESGWALDSFADDATGKVRLSIYRASASTSTSGQIANIGLAVLPTAALGVTPLIVSGNANVPPFSFSFVNGSVNVTAAPASVVNRRVFYNGASLNGSTTVAGATGFGASGTPGSSFAATGGNPPATAIDSKVALLTGGNSSFNNYTNVVFGINGIIVDIANPTGNLTVSDFVFATGETLSQSGFTTLVGTALTTVDPQVTQFVGGGISGSTRAKITFDNNTLKNVWLRVTVLANSNTGLAVNDVFYFGNVVGDTNGSVTSSRYTVNAIDTSSVRNNQSTIPNSVLVTNIFDFNKSASVNSLDTGVVRTNQQASGIVRVISNAPAFLTSEEDAPASYASATDQALTDLFAPRQELSDISSDQFDVLDGFFAAFGENIDKKRSRR